MYSDIFEDYFCSSTPCYYVIFPAINYGGYFEKYNVEVNLRKNGVTSRKPKSRYSSLKPEKFIIRICHILRAGNIRLI